MKEKMFGGTMVSANCTMTSDHRLDLYDVMRLLKVGTVVKHADGSICEVMGFDITKSIKEMPVTFRRIGHLDEFDGKLPEIAAMMVPCEGHD